MNNNLTLDKDATLTESKVLYECAALYECKKVIKLLGDLKKDLLNKKRVIIQKRDSLEATLKKISNKSVTIDNEKKALFERDYSHFLDALSTIFADADKQVEQWRFFLSDEEAIKKIPQDKLALYIKLEISRTKKFIKKTKKDVSVSHSRFDFSLDIQQKQLSYI